MAPQRSVKLPRLELLPRSSTNPLLHSEIDSILKDLKICSRKLQASFSLFQTELEVLDRLFYKGNNQHRTALFWRRVAGMRRFGHRLTSARAINLIDSVRLAFWGSPSENLSKVLKSAWSHVPDAEYVNAILKRLENCYALVQHLYDFMRASHDHLNLNLQTGAFLQYILTFTAIASRLAILASEIQPVLEQAWNACHRLLRSLDPMRAQRLKQINAHSKPQRQAVPKAVDAISSETHQEKAEDLGSAISTSLLCQESAVPNTGPDISPDDEIVTTDFNFNFKSLEHTTTIVASVERVTVARTITNPSLSQSQDNIKRKGLEDGQKLAKKKKKRKDDIDDIFGF